MARFYGPVGYSEGAVETVPGVWEETVVERNYQGDVIRNTRRLQDGESINEDISVGNSIAIIADAYANENIFAIRYVRWMGATWIVTNVEVRSPRLILQLGGVYNGKKAPAPQSP